MLSKYVVIQNRRFYWIALLYTIVPKDIIGYTLMNEKIKVNKLWNRRATTYYNGTSYIVQRGAEAL